MRRLGDPEYLRRALERAYQMRDVFEQVRAEQIEQGLTSMEYMVAASEVRMTLATMIAYYHRELRLLARHGGHGHRVQGAGFGRRGAPSGETAPADSGSPQHIPFHL